MVRIICQRAFRKNAEIRPQSDQEVSGNFGMQGRVAPCCDAPRPPKGRNLVGRASDRTIKRAPSHSSAALPFAVRSAFSIALIVRAIENVCPSEDVPIVVGSVDCDNGARAAFPSKQVTTGASLESSSCSILLSLNRDGACVCGPLLALRKFSADLERFPPARVGLATQRTASLENHRCCLGLL